jgi:hypothetical protein
MGERESSPANSMRLTQTDRQAIEQYWRLIAYMKAHGIIDPQAIVMEPLLSCETRYKLDWKYMGEGRAWVIRAIKEAMDGSGSI